MTHAESPPPPTLRALFVGFLAIGLSGFGGVLPWARRVVVERRRWLSEAEFTDLLGLCQFLPGPNVINLSVALGARFRGVAGSAACFAGLMAAPMAIVLVLGALQARYGALPVVQHLFRGLAAGASGLVLATAIRIGAPLRRHPAGLAIGLGAAAALALARLPLLPVLLAAAPLGILLTRRSGR